jgi:hypothetical protein
MKPTRLICAGAILSGALCGLPAVAPASERDFTFRRVAVPSGPVAGPRITVQIDPEEQARLLALPTLPPRPVSPTPPAGDSGGSPGSLAWFWDLVPPARAATGGRFLTALAALDAAPQGRPVPAPRLQTLQDIAAQHGSEILRASVGSGISPALVLAVIAVESAGRPQAVSPKGAQGLMQLMPATAERFGVQDANDPAQNIRGGVAYLSWLLREFDGDAVLALAGYNAGEGAVRRNDGVPPFAETRDYVPKVLAAWRVARGLCRTPPELPGDGCVFAVSGS